MRLKLFEEFKEDYFNTTLPEDEKEGMCVFYGKNVAWFGYPDNMIYVHKKDVHGMDGNIYNYDKKDYVVDLIENSHDYVEFSCSYGYGNIVELGEVVEHQEAYHSDRFEIDYEGHDEPYSTGDEELDRYIGIETNDLFDYDGIFSSVDGDFEDLVNKYRTEVALGRITKENILREFEELSEYSHEDSIIRLKEDLEIFFEYEERLKKAVDEKRGDIGKFKVQLRDAHHRCFGAIEAGEDYICLNLVDKDIKEYEGYYNKVTRLYESE